MTQPVNVIPILMPKAGQSMEEGTVVVWRVKPGDMIEKGQVILEIETDKAVVEVEAVDSGRLARITCQADESAAVLDPIAYLAENDSDVDAWLDSQLSGESQSKLEEPASTSGSSPSVDQPVEISTSIVPTDKNQIRASPSARRTARELGVSLKSVAVGSGPRGRILSTDVIKAAGVKDANEPVSPLDEIVRKKITPMRRAIARNLLLSKQTIPHFYMKQTIDAEPLYQFYQEQKSQYPCSVNDVVVSACARSMIGFPAFRSQLDGDELVEHRSSNIGIAIGLEDGLVVPVLRNVGIMTLREVADTSRRIVESARNGRIENMGQGLMTISNLGMFGIDEFSAIINPPEASILAVGAIRKGPVILDEGVRSGRLMTLTLSCDHRIIDGLIAARFMEKLKDILGNPSQIPGG